MTKNAIEKSRENKSWLKEKAGKTLEEIKEVNITVVQYLPTLVNTALPPQNHICLPYIIDF